MDSVREQIQNQLARSKVHSDELYSIIKQIADHIDPPKAVAPAPARTVKPAPAPAPAPAPSPAPAPAPASEPSPEPKKTVKRVVKKKVAE